MHAIFFQNSEVARVENGSRLQAIRPPHCEAFDFREDKLSELKAKIDKQIAKDNKINQFKAYHEGWEDRWEPIAVTSIVGRIVWIKYEDGRREKTYAQRIFPSNPENDTPSEQRKEIEKTLELYESEKDEA